MWGAFNIFQYITFRVGGAVLSSLFMTLAMGPWVIQQLRSRKIGQTQKSFGPPSHAPKAGTPTMGGLLIFVSIVANTLLWARLDNRFVWVMLFVTTGLSLIGMWDDYQKLNGRGAAGASSLSKFTVQIAVAFAVVLYLAAYPPNAHFATDLNVPYAKDMFLHVGILYYILALFMIIGASNAVNLTDGLDGLASGSVIFSALTYLLFAYVAGHAKFSTYLRIIPVEGSGEICVYLGALVGACLGFLWYNAYPAEVFMGDTSSLFLGGVIATVALCVKQELLLPIVGGVFVLETLSVIIQMSSFKFFKGKRVFKMAPLHHHFELSGIAESKVTVRFWIFGVVLMLVALASLKIR
jgi:phospho-N-acetylmuramoyl-pentapeptide-transferase